MKVNTDIIKNVYTNHNQIITQPNEMVFAVHSLVVSTCSRNFDVPSSKSLLDSLGSICLGLQTINKKGDVITHMILN